MTKQRASTSGASTGRGGWKRWSETEGADAVMRWRSSGLSVTAFAAREGVSTQRLHRWIRRVGIADAAALSPPPPPPDAPVTSSGRVRDLDRLATNALRHAASRRVRIVDRSVVGKVLGDHLNDLIA